MILRELLAKFGVEYDDRGARKADKDVDKLSGGFKELVALVGGAALLRGFGNFIVQQVQLADAVGDTAARLGIAVEALQEYRFAGQDVGMSFEGVDAALGRLVRGSAEAARGQGEAKDAFKELGVQLTDSQGNLLGFEAILTQVADGMGGARTDADRLRLGYALFGREGSKFAAAMKDGAAGIEVFRERARELGGVLSQEQVDAADKADKAMASFGLALGGVKHTIAAEFIPALTDGLTRLARWMTPLRELIRTSNVLPALLATLGGALAVMFGASRLLSLTKAGIAFAVIALAVEDIITWARGGDSVVGRLIDKFGGAGTSAATVGLLREAWQGLNEAFANPAGFRDFLLQDYFGQMFRDGVKLAAQLETIANAAVRAMKSVGRALNAIDVWAGNEPTFDIGPDSDEIPRRYGGSGGEPADYDFGTTPGVARAQGRNVNAGLEASGSIEQRGMGDLARPTLPTAWATSSMTPKSGPVINNNMNVTVDGAGMDLQQLGREFERRARKVQEDANAEALRVFRVVPP
jgi:hypothetical protein